MGTAEVVGTAAAAVPAEPAVGQLRHRTSIRPARELQARPGREIFRRIRCTGRSPPRTVAPPTSVSCISGRALLLRRLRKALNSMTVSSSAPFCIGCHQYRQCMRAYAFAPRPTESTFPSGPAGNRARGHSRGHMQVRMKAGSTRSGGLRWRPLISALSVDHVWSPISAGPDAFLPSTPGDGNCHRPAYGLSAGNPIQPLCVGPRRTAPARSSTIVTGDAALYYCVSPVRCASQGNSRIKAVENTCQSWPPGTSR